MTLQKVFERNGELLTAANTFERLFGEVDILKIIEMLDDGFTDVRRLGAPGAASQLFETFFNRLRKADSQHKDLAT